MMTKNSVIAIVLVLAGSAAFGGRSPDSLYIKAYGENQLFRTDKEGRNLVRDGVSFSWLNHNSGTVIDPAGQYIYEIYPIAHSTTILRRHNALTGVFRDRQLEVRAVKISCGTDGEYLYYGGYGGKAFVKVTLDGDLVNVTNTNRYYATFHGMGVAHDRLWITATDYPPTEYHGYPLSEFNGDTTLYNYATMENPMRSGIPMPVSWDGTHYYGACGWSPAVPSPLLRWDADYNFLDTVMLPIDIRSVMCFVPVTGVEEGKPLPIEFSVSRPAPNPLVRTGTIRLVLPIAERVKARLYDATGRQVLVLADGPLPAGRHELRVDATRLAEGVYLLKVEAGEFNSTRKLVVQR